MGCAASSGVNTAPHDKTVIHVPPPTQYPVAQSATSHTVQQTHTVTVTNLPNAPKSSKRKDSSSSSSSDDSIVDLEKQRKEIKERSRKAAAEKQSAVLSKDILLRYNALVIVINQLEKKNTTFKLEEKLRLSAELKTQAQKLNDEYKILNLKTTKELQDVQNLQSIAGGSNVFRYFENQAQFDTQMSKEQEEYIQAKTEMEDCYNRISALQSRQSILETEIATLKVDNEELQKHYKEQDDILDSIFDGAYGSDLEDQLENELDKKQEIKQRIELAFQKWKECDAMVKQASGQLNYAYDRWQSIQRLSFNNQNKMIIIQVAAQARSYLITAAQNLSSAQNILGNVKFPYCDRSEIATLNRAISFIFIDVQTRDRHAHAGQVYKTTRDRCYFLSQWVERVITNSVIKDLDTSRKECAELASKLRGERTRLMREKIEQETGQKVAFDVEPDSGIESDDDQLAPAPAEAEKVAEDTALDEQIKEAEKETAEGESAESADVVVIAKPVPLPLDELAPAPKQDELFGDLESIMAQYDKQREDYTKEMEANRARQQADFQMKLQARRSRKRRMMAMQQEVDEMMKKEQGLSAIEVPQNE